VKVRTLRLFAAALGLGVVAGAATAQEPAKLKLPVPTAPNTKSVKADVKAPTTKAAPMSDAKVAAAVADRLSTLDAAQSMTDMQMSTVDGAVTVVGTCKTDDQKKAVLKAVSTTDGVKLVKDGLKVAPAAAKPEMPTPAVPAPRPAAQPVKQAQMIGGPFATQAPVGVPPAAGIGNPDIEPMPLGPAGGGVAMGGPPMPNHAWPTYAPYPNMSRVAYPSAYPHNAFPYIGPYYPFPKVPLGWRSVTLSWEDGHWWLGRRQTPQDYWRVKFGY
jgi:BON domain